MSQDAEISPSGVPSPYKQLLLSAWVRKGQAARCCKVQRASVKLVTRGRAVRMHHIEQGFAKQVRTRRYCQSRYVSKEEA